MFMLSLSHNLLTIVLLFISCHLYYSEDLNDLRKVPDDLVMKVFTVATVPTDGFLRFAHSAQKYGHNFTVLGMGQEWQGGDIAKTIGGGHKVNFLKKALEDYKDQDNTIILFTDSFDVVLIADTADILSTFLLSKSRVLFSAEDLIWPDASLAAKYPLVSVNEKRFLNSGGFIGYARDVYKIVTDSPIKDGEDDQLYYTKIFLDPVKREALGIKLDTRAALFQSLHGSLDEVKLMFRGPTSYLYNVRTGTHPLVIHGNGPIKNEFNSLTNYLLDNWTPTTGCQACSKDVISLADVSDANMPMVTIGYFMDILTSFVDMSFDLIMKLNYPKEKIDLILYSPVAYHARHLEQFRVAAEEAGYHSVSTFEAEIGPREARAMASKRCLQRDCQYLFWVDGSVHLENADVLRHLIETNRSVIAPMVGVKNKMWSSFWGALSSSGFYKRSDDYVSIRHRERSGIWNVPYINYAILVHAFRLPEIEMAHLSHTDMDSDMSFCRFLREKGIFLYVDNQDDYGYLVEQSDYLDPSRMHVDLYDLFQNQFTWEKKYLNANYSKTETTLIKEPCSDVYWFPLVSEKFASDYIEEMEHYGQWSGGKNEDTRLQGGYENVPTVDIHTNQINWEPQWLRILKDYISPINTLVFPGFYPECKAIMNFVVRYRPGEQDHLRPHHDSSTFSINLALNDDYEGGGTRFLRQNCTMQRNKIGWALMHPGRMTHYHEGLRTTKGTRYIMVSFVDP